MKGLSGKTVIITGGGGGIGRALCLRFAAEGSRVAVLDRDEAAAQSTAELVTEAGGKAVAYAADITDYASIVETVEKIERDLGVPTVLVNNAGFDRFMPFLKTEPGMWQQLIDINLTGALNMHHVVLPKMLEAGGGKVINIASDAARVGSSGEAVYAACKAGLIGLSKTLARELASKNINFNVVCPGPTDTALLKSVAATSNNPEKLLEAFKNAVPKRRLGQPEDYPGIVCLLASDDADFITGQVISVSGGLTMAG
ncbi:SDR family NAD(P)-dependent oxidoreductase [Stutzerimonas xanthomarina]|uniref:2,3-dihydroxy-2,3-dihydro-p-cumate dehydrogenase n=2 Tax=Stutzerimonas xanthomarina TaxID=271420 RepID=A0A1M5M9Z0_9GAMM|nr:SDR family oxidoreductase [Stutzerimonas xanthomarina]MCP9338894.1 SDR family oxidoreductase [Stutzerimonas xanthomarina]SEH91331.1 2-hydroxycyclohexanecarboxyl-CoA dehydrogenase [Stutzerimonas xanthomarina]SHG74090.1 2-hydroxycyclohexanecarboxyl-CoA dehydrogenase [Stutzerimonas xanthomarina DSM 18231]